MTCVVWADTSWIFQGFRFLFFCLFWWWCVVGGIIFLNKLFFAFRMKYDNIVNFVFIMQPFSAVLNAEDRIKSKVHTTTTTFYHMLVVLVSILCCNSAHLWYLKSWDQKYLALLYKKYWQWKWVACCNLFYDVMAWERREVLPIMSTLGLSPR